MFAENVKLIKQAETHAHKIIENATIKGREIIKQAHLKCESMENELKERLIKYEQEKRKVAEEDAQRIIKNLNSKVEKEIKTIIENAQKRVNKAVNYVTNFIISL